MATRKPFKHRVPRKPKAAPIVEVAPLQLVGKTAPRFDRADVLAWKARIDSFEEEVRSDAQLTGGCPLADYTDQGNAPFNVPAGMFRAIRDLTSPEGREQRYREGLGARREAAHRRALAAMLREKGDVTGAELQETAALEFARIAAEAGVVPDAPATEAT